MSIARPKWYDWVDEEKTDELPCGSEPIFKKGTPKSVIEQYKKDKQQQEELARQGIIE